MYDGHSDGVLLAIMGYYYIAIVAKVVIIVWLKWQWSW